MKDPLNQLLQVHKVTEEQAVLAHACLQGWHHIEGFTHSMMLPLLVSCPDQWTAVNLDQSLARVLEPLIHNNPPPVLQSGMLCGVM